MCRQTHIHKLEQKYLRCPKRLHVEQHATWQKHLKKKKCHVQVQNTYGCTQKKKKPTHAQKKKKRERFNHLPNYRSCVTQPCSIPKIFGEINNNYIRSESFFFLHLKYSRYFFNVNYQSKIWTHLMPFFFF